MKAMNRTRLLVRDRLRALLQRRGVERELDEELRFHIRMREEENVRRGMSRDEARRAARRSFGSLTRIKEACRDVKGGGVVETLIQDVRFGARMLRKDFGFTLVSVLTLALGIGATTAIFSVVNAVLLRPLPYPEADRLLYVGQQYRSGIAGSGEPKFLFWREQSQSFEALACSSSFGGAGGNLSGGTEAQYVRGLRVSEDFFRVLGIYPAQGRAFTHDEDMPGGASVAILSDKLWQRSFGGDTGIIGRTVTLNDQPMTVVGIMPPQFRLASGAELFVPMRARAGSNIDPNADVVGRLKPGVSLQQAQAELKVIAEKYRAAFPRQMQEGETVAAEPYQDLFTEGLAKYLWIILGAVTFLLLIACVNVANLQLARVASRQREVAVRIALGAAGGRIVRQLLTEGLLLALAGGTAGFLFALWGTQLLTALTPEDLLPGVAVIGTDWHVLAFAFAAAITTGLLFGLGPAWQARKVDVNAALKENSGKGAPMRGRLRGSLVVIELALSLTLLVGAGLLVRTFFKLISVAPGFDPHNVLTFQIALNGKRYDTTNGAAAFYRDALERISKLPGVEAAAVTNKLPLDWQFNMPVVFPGKPDQSQSVQVRTISADYFRVMKIGVRQGRAFGDADDSAAPPVAIVNEAFARRYFDGQTALAQQLSIGRGLDDPPREVIGVVSDIKQQSLDRPAPPMVFVPIPQLPDKLMKSVRAFTSASFVVRTTVAPASLSPSIKHEIAALDPTLPLSHISSMEEVAARSIASQRFNMLLLGSFAALGLLLAAVGIYGVMSYMVAQHTREIGIRMALGAQARDVVRLVVGQGLRLTLAGIIVGLAGAFALTRLMTTLLFGVTATDPATFVAIPLLLVAVALAACFIPARRATRVEPTVALRYE
ncbi:MAG: putative transport system permease protein [Acidobacteriota bacterium]|jgi:predicted permease|nr:putative transport system permease protein [Acidobacteriota bacterium]